MKTLREVRLSVLDLVPYPVGKTIADAFQNTRVLAQAAERFGYHRFWMAEHHSLEGIASAATPVLIGFVAENTKTIRVGSGGMMLPNHSPLIVAEQFGTLATLYPDRIDLGLGRAPGTDQTTMRAIRGDAGARGEDFDALISELEAYLAPAVPGQRIVAIPGAGIDIPIWILGSSLYSAHLAARLGRPYAFAGHFAPALLMEALDVYRSQFRPSRHLQQPHVMVGVPIVAADTKEHAEYLATSAYQRGLSLIRGKLQPLPPPVSSMEGVWRPGEEASLRSLQRLLIVGDLAVVREGMRRLAEATGADELIVTSDLYDFSDRVRSYELVAEAGRGT